MPELMIFKAGKYPQGDWPKERVQKIAESYDPEKNIEAPAVIGHRIFASSDEDQMAHGWVKSLRMDKSGNLYANIEDWSHEIKRAIAEKKLRYMSVEIFEFDAVDPKQPPYLKAVAFLGRDTPAVSTARVPAMFGFMGGGTVTEIDKDNHLVAFTRKLNAEDIALMSAVTLTDEPKENGEGNEVTDLEKLQAELEKKNAELAAFSKENTELKNAGKKTEATAFFAKLRDEGRLTPALFEKAVALDVKLGDSERAELRALFGELAPQVDLSGAHVADKKKAVEPAAGSAELTAKIKAFQTEKKIGSFADAASALYAEKPELFSEGGKA